MILEPAPILQAQIESQVSTGDRSAKTRTYNFPKSRVTDHRIGFTLHSLPEFLEGEIGDMVITLIEADGPSGWRSWRGVREQRPKRACLSDLRGRAGV